MLLHELFEPNVLNELKVQYIFPTTSHVKNARTTMFWFKDMEL